MMQLMDLAPISPMEEFMNPVVWVGIGIFAVLIAAIALILIFTGRNKK